MKRIGVLAMVLVLTISVWMMPIAAYAQSYSMTWKQGDKAYISIIIDDNNAELQRMYDLITGEYSFPLCVAVPVRSFDPTLHVSGNKNSLALLHEIENHGGEILSHTLTHQVFNTDISWETVDYELGESYRRLTQEGFNVNGVILAGGGGTEDTSEAYRAQLENYTAKYYKYSDYYGVSTQYYHPRKWFYNGYRRVKSDIDAAIKNKTWEVFAAHGIDSEISDLTEKNLRMMLDYLKGKQEEGVLEVVTYKEAHEKHAQWTPSVSFGKTKYTVDFYDYDDKTLLNSQVVFEGESATAPSFDTPDGMVFEGWSGSFENIAGNVRVYAVCSTQTTVTTQPIATEPITTETITVTTELPMTTIISVETTPQTTEHSETTTTIVETTVATDTTAQQIVTTVLQTTVLPVTTLQTTTQQAKTTCVQLPTVFESVSTTWQTTTETSFVTEPSLTTQPSVAIDTNVSNDNDTDNNVWVYVIAFAVVVLLCAGVVIFIRLRKSNGEVHGN